MGKKSINKKKRFKIVKTRKNSRGNIILLPITNRDDGFQKQNRRMMNQNFWKKKSEKNVFFQFFAI